MQTTQNSSEALARSANKKIEGIRAEHLRIENHLKKTTRQKQAVLIRAVLSVDGDSIFREEERWQITMSHRL